MKSTNPCGKGYLIERLNKLKDSAGLREFASQFQSNDKELIQESKEQKKYIGHRACFRDMSH